MKKILMAAAAIMLLLTTAVFTSCQKLEELDGMNDGRAYYSYKAQSTDSYEYQVAAGDFDLAIHESLGRDPIIGGNDGKVIEACNACYENLKQRLSGKPGMVFIYKIRHPDAKMKIIKEYTFQ